MRNKHATGRARRGQRFRHRGVAYRTAGRVILRESDGELVGICFGDPRLSVQEALAPPRGPQLRATPKQRQAGRIMPALWLRPNRS